MAVNLTKGQAISLEKSGGGLTRVRMGLGWKAIQRKGLSKLFGTKEIDLDASAMLFSNGQLVDEVSFRKLASSCGSVRHGGDNLTGGAGAGGDDEAIWVDLTSVPPQVDQIVFTVNSYTGQTFAEVEAAFCRLVDESSGEEMARYTLTGGGPFTGQIMAKVQRVGNGWSMTAIGAPANGRVSGQLLPAITPHL
ncbi:TerD family protein [Streptomyces calidiresistens]|uniref:TerD family protein n=1 Tax=Streptomyces calidiresistens TaxID=1485586 RepID=A0A7W3T503_9ACTN|nr:TerD family protein [Streptomyces calidiresistens]MBB0231060.1 TerD family protein [Streptomyces calidiresistens]